MAGTFSRRSDLPESRTCIFSNVQEVDICGLAKKLTRRELAQSELLRVKNV